MLGPQILSYKVLTMSPNNLSCLLKLRVLPFRFANKPARKDVWSFFNTAYLQGKDAAMYGWIGKVLRVNLTKGECTSENLDLGLAKRFIGGRGLAIQSKEHRAIQKLNEGGKRGTRQG